HFTLRRSAVPAGISTLVPLLLTVYGTQGVTFCRFTAESDAAGRSTSRAQTDWLYGRFEL
ncbi:hypothetical protein ID856_19030, partial [Xenorhabdus sp. 18]|uniref:hypothetical protein n=1 Tax=Xenorhabdus doucetiae TaxID=351671 RepID=UPI00198B8964